MTKHRNKLRSAHKPAATPAQPSPNRRAMLAAAFGLGLIVVSAIALLWMSQNAATSAAAPVAPTAIAEPTSAPPATANAPAAASAALPIKRVNALTQIPAGQAERVEVAYFHRTQRCAGCAEAERLIRKTLDSYFTDQVASGAIHLAVTDVQKPEIAALTSKYSAAGSSLFFSIVKDGVEYLCPINDVWYVLGNEARFLPLLRERINAALGEG